MTSFCDLLNTDVVNRTNSKRALSCSQDSSTIGSPLSSPKCTTSLSNSKQFAEYNASSTFSGSLLSPSSSSEMLVTGQPSTTYSNSPAPVSNSYTSLPTSTLNSPSAIFSSCMFPEIPAFSPSDSALPGCATAHVPASGAAYVDCSAAAEAELTPVGVNEGGVVEENGDEGGVPMTSSTTLKRSLSGTFNDHDDDDNVATRCPSKRACNDSDQRNEVRSKGLIN